ncbi:MAG: DUF1566 domain-containing protein [Desulfobulbaceae bacterium]|nr:DUF1566 domain-containing protein [Desulfobulbaceae bacterium]
MKKIVIKKCALYSLAFTLLFPAMSLAGDLEPVAAPDNAASAVFTTDDLYNRLQTGAEGTKRNTPFSEPTAGPADGVGRSLDEIMTIAPAADNVNGATQADVTTGKTFWGLRTDGTWGLKPGTAPASSPYPAPVPKSGQTTCYTDAGAVISCSGSGQDGAKRMGVSLPMPRFIDNSNGTVTDNLTGLIWLKNANCTTVSPKAFIAAQTAVAALKGDGTMCSLTDGSVAGDWRVPNRRELFSLVNDQYVNPSLSNTAGTAKWTAGNPFTGVQNSYYWSSTNYINSPSNAWYVTFNVGDVYGILKSQSCYVWPVRGGQ